MKMWDETKYPLGNAPLFKGALSKSEEVLFVILVKGMIHQTLSRLDIPVSQWPSTLQNIITLCQDEFMYVLQCRKNHEPF